MPLTPLNNDFLQCPICFNAFSLSFDRKPITLSCCHTCCSSCLKSLQSCPFDQTTINHDLPENEAILSLLIINNPNLLNTYLTNISNMNCEKLINYFDLSDNELRNYRKSIDCIQNLAQLIKPQNSTSNLLSRPMQRKLISLINCQLVEGDGRSKAIKFCRSIGERITSELLLKHQDPYALSANLWAAVRSRGCQFLGPQLQEEILKLVLSALEDGSHLSRKVLVMYVVQRLSPHFPHQASKTAIGHVIQLLYRASCFRLTKRDGDSSLMQLKEDYCSYEALRREHDTQIVSIALESGLKISPDQWSSFLYGSPTYKSHMQSIIDKLQSPQSFNQSIQELIIALQRTQDPANLIFLKDHLERLAKIESVTNNESFTIMSNLPNEDTNNEEKLKENNVKELKDNIDSKDLSIPSQKIHQQYPTYEELSEILDSCKIITFRLVDFLKQYNILFSNVFRFSRSTNFNNTGKFKNGKTFINGKSKSPTIEEATKVNKLDANSFNQNSISMNCKNVQGTPSSSILTTGINNSFVNTNLGKLDSNTTNSINSISTSNCLNKLNKLKPCAYVPPIVLQQQQNSNLNGTLNSTLNSANKISLNSLNQSSYCTSNTKMSNNKSTINGKTTTAIKLNSTTTSTVNKVNGSLTNGNSINSLSTTSLSTANSTKTDYLGKSLIYSTSIANENHKNNQNIQNNQQQIINQLNSPIKQELLDVHSNYLNQLLQLKQKNGYKKSNPNSFSFDDADDQFIPFADQPKISKFGPISRTMNLINTQTVTGSSKIGLKSDNINDSSICKNTNTIIGALPSLIKPFNSSLFISNESTYIKK